MEPGRGREGQVEPRLSPEDAAEARKILHAPEVSTEVKDTVREILVQDQERRLGQLRQEFTDNQGNPRTPLHAKLLQHAETELNSLKTAESPGSSSQPSQPDSDITVVLPTATSSHGTSQQPHQQTTQPETAQAISFGDFSENLSRNLSRCSFDSIFRSNGVTAKLTLRCSERLEWRLQIRGKGPGPGEGEKGG